MTLESMAAAFGVSPAFMDAELAEFIVAGRVSAKIDKVLPGPVKNLNSNPNPATYCTLPLRSTWLSCELGQALAVLA